MFPNMIVVRISEEGTCLLRHFAISGDTKCDQKIRREVPNIQSPYNRNAAHVERKTKNGTSNDRDNCNRLRITQTVPEQRTGKARN